MTNNASAGCRIVAEYVDEGDVPADVAYHAGEAVRPHRVANYLDLGSQSGAANEELVHALLQVVQDTAHGPSRAQMLETIARLQAVEAIREILRHEPLEGGVRMNAVQALSRLFTP